MAAIGALAWGLVGCGADPGDAEPGVAATGVAEPVISAENGSSSAPAPQAFVFESGVLEIGDFDPYTLGDNIFDPCTEITPEEFAAAGFDRVEPLPEEYAGLARGLSVCEVYDSQHARSAVIMSNDADFAAVSTQTGLLEHPGSSILPSAFVYGPSSGRGMSCYSQIDLTRGGFVVSVPGLTGYDDQSENCDLAMAYLERILTQRLEPSVH